LLFPYLILTLVMATIYGDRQKNALANRGELLALGFGVLLTALSTVGTPLTIFINLSLTAVALLIIQARRSPTSKDLPSLVYFAHIVTLSAIVSGVYFFTRSTSIFGWVGFFLATMLVEWIGVLVIGKFSPHPQILSPSIEVSPHPQPLSLGGAIEPKAKLLLPSPSGRGAGGLHLPAWRDSAWHIGASLAALSYVLLWNSSSLGIGSNSESVFLMSYWGVAWLVVPLSLTFLGTWREFADRDLAIRLSIAGLAIAQILTWQSDGSQVIGLGVAFALMLVNTRRSKSLFTAFNTVGYGLLFIAFLLWQFKSGSGATAQFIFWTNGMVFSAILLYMLNHWLKYRRDRHVANLDLPLNQSYSQAFDIWAALLSVALLSLQTYQAALVFGLNQDSQLFINLLPSTILVVLGLIYRLWQETGRSPFWTEWGIAWSIELLTSGAIAVTNGSAIELAIANLVLGFVTQLCGDWWMQRNDEDEYPRSWDVIPLIYGVMGSLLRIGSFSGLTGLFSLGTSLIGIGIGRRASQSNPIFKVLTYLSMVVATFSAYELLFYQMVSSSQGGSLGDGLIILATLGCAIAYAYNIFTDWIVLYLRLSPKEIGVSAHLHWTASAIFLVSASFFSLSVTGGAIAQFIFWTNGMVFSAILLYMLNHWLKYRRDRRVANLDLPLNQSYSQAFDIWAALLSVALLSSQTYQAALVFGFNQDSQLFINLLPSTILVVLGLIYRLWQETGRSPLWTEWAIAWSIELLTLCAIAVTNGSAIELAIANLALGFVTQLCGDWWMQRNGEDEYPRSWDVIPLIYGVMGSLLRIGSFSGLTGLFSLSTSLIGIGIGRRASQSNPIFKALTYLSMVVATFSAYELLFYQMVSSSQGGSLGDGLIILATLGCAIAYAYNIFTDWIVPYLRLSPKEIGISAHLHWTASAIFLVLASFLSPSVTGGAIGGGVAIALAAYAIAQGRRTDLWIYTGLSAAIGAIAYFIFFAFPNPWLITNFIQPYAAAIACIIAAILYLPNWEELGWTEQPWHNSAFALPLIFAFITQTAIAIPCLLIVGIFYLIYAKVKDQIRITYITVFLWDWVIFANLSQNLDLSTSLRFLISICTIGFSGLYFAQVEPNLRSPHTRDLRHTLRSLLSGGMGLIAFLYSFTSTSIAFSTWGLSFAFIIAGLAFRVRAYLFMGTLTFILLVITQAVTLVTQYSFLMWALGIVAGIGFILVAANFEVRRDRIMALFRNVTIELETWD